MNRYLNKISTMIKFTEPKKTPDDLLKAVKEAPAQEENYRRILPSAPQPVYRWPAEGWKLT